MGLLVEGTWKDRWYPTEENGGRFVRTESAFRDEVSAASDARFAPARGRYHLYVSHACPWAHRTMIFRALKGLNDVLAVTVVEPDMLENGWEFSDRRPDPLSGARYLYEVYQRAMPTYSGRVTVPVLWDTQEQTIVNNESSEIIRMFDTAFESLGDPSAPLHGVSMRPDDLTSDIDAINEIVYHRINNGVYKCGFATSQAAYDEAVTELFEALDLVEARLADQRYLTGERLTEADWRLFTTLVRFDPVYHGHFKCSRNRIVDFPHIMGFARELYQVPGVANTIHIPEIRRHYYYSHESVNPHRIVPMAPAVDLDAPHGRDQLPGDPRLG